MLSRVIHIQPAAPPKPAAGQPCNGCGVCCLYEPCPLGRLLSRRRQGACRALHWDAAQSRYCCGALSQPRAALRIAWPGAPSWLVPALVFCLRRLAPRWIAAGQGCDCHLEPAPGELATQSDRQSRS